MDLRLPRVVKLSLLLLPGLTCGGDVMGEAERPGPRTPASASPGISPRWRHMRTSMQSPPASASPHWRHMRTSTIDYRIHYLNSPQKEKEYDWAAAHYDHVTGGALDEYRRRNPTIQHFVYDTFWFIPVTGAGEMEAWLTANGFDVESAYLHVAGTSKTLTNRITAQQFANRDYWYYNPGDPGFRAWRLHRTRSLTEENAQGNASGSLFFDTSSRSTVRKYVPAGTLEYDSWESYFADFHSRLSETRGLVKAGFLMLNQAQHFTKADDVITARIAGGTMTEYGNTPYGNSRWDEVDQLVSSGVVVQFGTAVSPGSKNNSRYNSNAGNYATIADRVLMWEYASYLMVVDPARMDAVLFETYGLSWSHPFRETWLTAFETDIGLATGPRTVLVSGTDGAGQSYQVFQRPFESGLVLIRPQGSRTPQGDFEYGDPSAVAVTPPGGPWRMLLADGTVTEPTTSVQLRTGEAAILIH
jgi:hypothetical protein